TIDTLDYSGSDLNVGSKVIFAAAGEKKRALITEIPTDFPLIRGFKNGDIVLPGILIVEAGRFVSYEEEATRINNFANALSETETEGIVLIVLCDDAEFTGKTVNNFVWVTFTRSNPSHDIYGVGSFIEHKHWGCVGPIIIDARHKPHHAPELLKLPEIERKVDRLGVSGGSLHGII